MMNTTAIRVSDLYKQYRIGNFAGQYKRFTETIANLAKNPLKHFRDASTAQYFWALNDISFELTHGEVLGVIGRNGAGKSTLLKVISRITRPTKGRIELHGRVGSLLEVGTGFHPELTGRENLYLNGAILGMHKTEIDRKLDDIVEFADIAKFLDTPVKRYSTGMYMRLAFSVAAHLESEILLIDEVLAVGDLEFQRKCLAKMGDVSREEGRSIILVSHNMSSILNLCKRAILLEKGKLILDGKSNEVIEHYISVQQTTQEGEMAWETPDEAPGNEDIRLQSIRVLSSDQTVTTDLSSDEEIIIQISYWNFRPGARYIINLNLREQNGGWVFTTLNTPSASLEPDPWFNRPHPEGLFRTTCRIPANLLNSQTFYVYLAIAYYGNFSRESIIGLQDIVSFTVYDSGAMTKEYSGAWLGPIRTRLAWVTQFIGDKQQ
jgi:lipopolysaccharide transport system ATP-binding protein